MAYTPINWQTGDTITAEKMNKMDNGWSISFSQLFSETVVTVDEEGLISGLLSYDGIIDFDEITVTFNGVDYGCERHIIDIGVFAYGGLSLEGLDFTDYPFVLVSSAGTNMIYAQTAGTHTIAAVAMNNVDASAEFVTAVKSIADTSTMPFLCVSGATTLDDMVYAIIIQKRLSYFVTTDGAFYIITQLMPTSDMDAIVHFSPAFSLISASVTNGIFTVTES